VLPARTGLEATAVFLSAHAGALVPEAENSPLMLDQKDFDALRDGAFWLDCAEMTLTQRATAAPRVLRGPGRFHQDADGAVSFTLYANGVHHLPFSASPVGHTIPEDR